MKNLTLEHIAKVCNGSYVGAESKKQQSVSSITTDSRKIQPGGLFVPVKGARVDAHSFIEEVMEKGALCTLSEKDLGKTAYPYIRVTSSLEAVKAVAEYYLEGLKIPVVGITGSVGKTSTKEMIAAVLSQKFNVLKTQGNFNNELGLPLTIFELREEHEIAVLEMGISEFGEMHRLAQIAKPDTCVITNIGDCHLENLKTRDGVLQAKTEIFDFLKKGGHILLNGDDEKLRTIKEVKGITPLFFGVSTTLFIYADKIEHQGLKGSACRIHIGGESFQVHIPVPGMHMVYNALAGAAAGYVYGLTPNQIKSGIESLKPVTGRFHIIETENYTIIDDCYNANPMSMKASLEILQSTLTTKTAILGDMGELGADEIELHREVGRYAAGMNLDTFICAGPLSRYIAEAAKEVSPKMKVIHLDSLEQLLEQLKNLVSEGDTVLVKASHFMQFEKVVDLLSSY